MMKNLTLILIVITLLFSCKTKQIIVEKTNTIYDTVRITKKEIVIQPFENKIFIENPCDSTGILKSFKQTIKSGKINVTIQSKENNITATIQNLDSIKSVWEKEFKSHIQIKKEFKETITYKTPKWNKWIMSILSILVIWGNRKFLLLIIKKYLFRLFL